MVFIMVMGKFKLISSKSFLIQLTTLELIHQRNCQTTKIIGPES